MRYGDPLMYIAWIALALYLAAYIPLFVGITRIAVHRWQIPLIAAAPVVWTGLEYLRGFLMTGFGWYYLGHSQYRWVELIQISDVTGAYGVSFVMMLFTSAVAMQLPYRWFRRLQLFPRQQHAPEGTLPSPRNSAVQLAVVLVCLASVVGYGYWRRTQADFHPGPRVALIQGNFRAAMDIPPSEYEDSFHVHNELTGYAVKHQPDLIVWPEGMFRYALQQADPGMSRADLAQAVPFFPPESWERPATCW